MFLFTVELVLNRIFFNTTPMLSFSPSPKETPGGSEDEEANMCGAASFSSSSEPVWPSGKALGW